ncbi:hypothetical protein MIND_00456700 [Mycena indigotica]|uniref:RNI-like protein n=1 Tax=Mycena indigotica TaxID=2126181 RepID=A0A8H6SXK5_9AGAR|nr:uncharacterized protein MIND_00456700 [Mycena indigotica]KAF7306652.1 hypothetical protein MIND_00456700 [Mycena indigotica]
MSHIGRHTTPFIRTSMPPRKRAKIEFGAATEDDNPSAAIGAGNPSSSAPSTRPPRYTSVPKLTTLASRVFAENFLRLHHRETLWKERLSVQLLGLPETLLPLLLLDLTQVCPTYLTHGFLVTYFFRGHSLTLDSSLTGVNNHSIRALQRMSTNLRDLEVSGFKKVPDKTFADAIRHLPNLRRLVLRGCSLAGPATMKAAESCTQMQIANFNYTAVTPAALQPFLLACHKTLTVLKLAGIPNWTDATFRKMLSPDLTLPQLLTLKVCRLNVSEAPLNDLTNRCPALRRLDISFTAVRHPFQGTSIGTLPFLEKLYLTSTSIPNPELLSLLPQLNSLTSLALGALGASPRSISAIDSSMTLTDSVLLQFIPHLQSLKMLTNLSLVGNTKLSSSLGPLIAAVGRNCKWLNLSSIPGLRSQHLAPLVPDDELAEAPSRLETLLLNNTGIDDDAAPFLASCASLRWLEVAETKMTSDGLFSVLDGCVLLTTLGLKSCRGVRVSNRRRFFEAGLLLFQCHTLLIQAFCRYGKKKGLRNAEYE